MYSVPSLSADSRSRRRLIVRLLCGFVLVAWSTSAAWGQVRFRSGEAAFPHQKRSDMASALSDLSDLSVRGGAVHVVVQFDEPVSAGQKNGLRAAGLELLGFLGDNAYFASIKQARLDTERVIRAAPIRVIAPIDPAWKLHPSLARNEVPDHAVRAGSSGDDDAQQDWLALYVLFHGDVPLATDGLDIAARHGAAVHSTLRSVNGLVLELPRGRLGALVAEDGVQYVEPALPRFGGTNDSNRALVGADAVQAAPNNLDGSGITVMIFDIGAGLASHPDFGGRLTTRDTSPVTDHSTHVAGIVGGNGAQSGGVFRGMAPGVELLSYGLLNGGILPGGFLFSDPGDLEAKYGQAIVGFGATLANNSLGSNVASNQLPCEWEGDYGVTAALIDAIVGGSLGAPFRIIWAGGNERGDGRCNGAGGFNTLAPPASAKNHILIGAVYSDTDEITDFSSFGPTDDGRLKPDVAAPGCQLSGDEGVTSTSFTGGYISICGTSMSAPTVTGVCALLLQDFLERVPDDPFPTNAALKALLVQTAMDNGNPGPDFRSGYGSVRVEPALDLLRSERWREDEVGHEETAIARVVVEPLDPEFKITLAWDDAPGTPNVVPNLVNDLDLRVFDPLGNRHYPWTLDAANPSAAATRTQSDGVNNVEQVAVDDPVAGTWSVEIHGANVPVGPQRFAVAASGNLLQCSSQGTVSLDRDVYRCNSTVEIIAVDCDLNDDAAIDSTLAQVTSTSDPVGMEIALIETTAESADFRGPVGLAPAGSGFGLDVVHRDTVTATMIDADNGAGATNAYLSASARIDCEAPEIIGIANFDVTSDDAVVGFATDEPTRGTVRFGTSCGALDRSARDLSFATTHSIALRDLAKEATYSYVVEAEDRTGLQTMDNNGGSCRSFTTPSLPVFFTEFFSSGFDLENTVITFTPDGSADFYTGCAEPISELPVTPIGGTVFDFFDDDFAGVFVSGGRTVSLYGRQYPAYFVSSNGYVTFLGGDLDWFHQLSTHFDQPRVSALFVDLSPNEGGTVRVQSFSDREVITWLEVPEFDAGNENTFQLHLHTSGKIQIYYLNVDANIGIVGLSDGGGTPPAFSETDLSAMNDCLAHPPAAVSISSAAPVGLATSVILSGFDDGEPNPPGELQYVIASLPAHGSLRDPLGGLIRSVPYTLRSAGRVVRYTSQSGYRGGDAFRYLAFDGGSFPLGGQSGAATVWISTGGPSWDPVADDVAASTTEGTPVDVVLAGSDPNGNALRFVIRSLPPLGRLVEPDVGLIGSVPYALQPGTDVVRFVPPLGQAFQLPFGFAVRDVSTESSVASATVTVGGGTVLYVWDMDTDPGFAIEGEWGWGPPTGRGSHNPDPTAGFSGANVLGYNLNGDYGANLPPTAVTTSPMDFRGYTNIILSFRRWLGVEESGADHASVEISIGGSGWTTVWEHNGPTLAEEEWSLQQLDLTEYAADKSLVSLRWVMGATNAAENYSGWNLDDVEITGVPDRPLRPGDLTLDGEVDLADFATLVDCFGLSEPAGVCNPAEFELCDLSVDGAINLADFAIFALHFGG